MGIQSPERESLLHLIGLAEKVGMQEACYVPSNLFCRENMEYELVRYSDEGEQRSYVYYWGVKTDLGESRDVVLLGLVPGRHIAMDEISWAKEAHWAVLVAAIEDEVQMTLLKCSVQEGKPIFCLGEFNLEATFQPHV